MIGPGTHLAHYEILEAIGKGGMGEVWRAKDTKLGRDVAIKTLPPEFAQDADRLARFEREAKLLASLNHPNIAAIYGLEESGDTRALVLELVEGPTLADRIAQGPIPVDEALPIAKQIAEALEAAHEAGVIHRDLKPANVKVKDDGTVKVLDFGLAKVLDPTPEGDPSESPTLTAAATQMGVIMGTAAYMSPEQARGKPVDKRADIWALGCLLFEMLSGGQTWEGETVTDVLAAVVSKNPDFTRLPGATHPRVRHLLKRCLQKNLRQRWHDAGDVRVAIEEVFEDPDGTFDHSVARHDRESPRRSIGWLGVGALAGAILGAVAVWGWSPSPVIPVARASIELAGGLRRIATLALSPDGQQLVYAANGQLYLRPMDRMESTAIPGTQGARYPFFSSDGESVGFFTATELKRVDLGGGAPVVLANVTEGLGGVWGTDDQVIFGRIGSSGLFSVSATGGGEAALFADLEDHWDLEFPEILPGGEWVLFTDNVSNSDDWNESDIVAQSIRTGERKLVVERGQMARYSRTGHLVFARDGWLYGVAFDSLGIETIGEPVALVDGLAVEDSGVATKFAIAGNGTLVFAPAVVTELTAVWVDREGREQPIGLPARDYYWPRLSPEETHLAISINEANRDVWISELTLGTLAKLTTDASADDLPLWSVDGQQIVFASAREDGQYGFFAKRADGTGPVDRLLVSDTGGWILPHSWSPAGTSLAFSYLGSDTSMDIGLYEFDGLGDWEPLLATEAKEMQPAISPDGDWIAYASDLTGTFEIYVERFPNLGDRQLVSTGGGRAPVWSGDGSELFYRRLSDGAMMLVPIARQPGLTPGPAQQLFEGADYSTGAAIGDEVFVNYDVTANGQRFLMLKGNNPQVRVNVVYNWHRELLERVPVP